jgi:hypothetical protein
MSNEDNSLESGSDVETERRDYPGTSIVSKSQSVTDEMQSNGIARLSST